MNYARSLNNLTTTFLWPESPDSKHACYIITQVGVGSRKIRVRPTGREQVSLIEIEFELRIGQPLSRREAAEEAVTVKENCSPARVLLRVGSSIFMA